MYVIPTVTVYPSSLIGQYASSVPRSRTHRSPCEVMVSLMRRARPPMSWTYSSSCVVICLCAVIRGYARRRYSDSGADMWRRHQDSADTRERRSSRARRTAHGAGGLSSYSTEALGVPFRHRVIDAQNLAGFFLSDCIILISGESV